MSDQETNEKSEAPLAAATCYVSIAEHFENIATLMAQCRAYDGAARAQEAADAFRRVTGIITARQAARKYFGNDEGQDT